MKVFVAITLLATCVAPQTFDHHTGLRQLLKREHGLVKDIYGNVKTLNHDTLRYANTYPYTIPTSYNTINDVDTLTLEELIQHPLFQTYYTLPLFRQHFTQPLFRLYLTTPYFQKYWTQPIFTTFFRNPYLFNKYIYPIVYKTVPTTGVYDRAFGVNTNDIFGDYTQTKVNTQTTPFQTIFGKKYTDVVYPFNTGYPINNNYVQYVNTIEKILKTILLNKPEITDINFNIHTPIEKRTFEKVIDPITGEVKYIINTDDFKTIDEKITPVDKIVEREFIKNSILKKILLNKIIYGDRKIGQTIPEIFNVNQYETVPQDLLAKYTIPTELIHKFQKIPREHTNQYETTIPLEYTNKVEKIPSEVITKLENIPRDLEAKYTIPTELTKKFEKKTTPLGYVNRFAKIPREQLVKTSYETIPREFITNDEKIDNIETVVPQEIEITKKTEKENKIENIMPEEIIETETTHRVRRQTTSNADTTTVNAADNTREGKTYYYVPLTHTYGHQIYTVPTTYVVGEQHQAQVPVTKDASTVYTQTPVAQQVVYNTAPLGYHYGSHYTVPTTYTYGAQSSVYYPTHTYITA